MIKRMLLKRAKEVHRQYLMVGFKKFEKVCVNTYYGRYEEERCALQKELIPKLTSQEIQKILSRFATAKGRFVYLESTGVVVRKDDVAYIKIELRRNR